jgi:hypothetical protein
MNIRDPQVYDSIVGHKHSLDQDTTHRHEGGNSGYRQGFT